jgi:hypothetical protein
VHELQPCRFADEDDSEGDAPLQEQRGVETTA